MSRRSPGGLTFQDRFWRSVDRRSDDECWPWVGNKLPNGYGIVHSFGKYGTKLRVHRVSYELLVGPIPPGLEIDHLCRNRACVNPAHLEPVTHAENCRRARKTHCKRGHALTEENTRPCHGGGRHCLACGRIYGRVSRERKRSAA